MSNQPMFQQTTTTTEYSHPPSVSDYSQSPITSLELPHRMESALYMAGYKTVGDVLALTEATIISLPNVGKKSLDQLRLSLKARGLSLKGDRIEEKPPQTEETTPPQDGAPVTESQGGSVPQCLPQSRRYTRVLPIYAIIKLDVGDMASSPQSLLIWEIRGANIIPVDIPPKFVVDFYRENEGFFHDNHLHVCIRMRSFFGLVDNLIPIMDTEVSNFPKLPVHPKVDEAWWDRVEETVKKVLFNA